ncbi:MAG: YggS family pyridoxal phosphate-dependent enzyme [Oscillospiraceae bacterium]|nr:YggS family pyridoxal phosphate-dependent enzyme [Oscillospiraceae bacterium]
MVRENLKEVEEHIQEACRASSRSRDEVTLIAVSKTKPVSMLMEAYDSGIRVFGENKVQELCDKYEEMPKDIQWHMIGHLQTNKVKYIVDKVAMIHSVDSVHLAEVIQKEAAKKQVTVPILIEVNVAEEESKFGITLSDALAMVTEIAGMPNVRIEGLMTIAPFVENPEENRKYFKALKQLAVDINAKNIDNVHVRTLSMGMTNDYMEAIEEGATMVRVGTGIFGERNYNI